MFQAIFRHTKINDLPLDTFLQRINTIALKIKPVVEKFKIFICRSILTIFPKRSRVVIKSNLFSPTKILFYWYSTNKVDNSLPKIDYYGCLRLTASFQKPLP